MSYKSEIMKAANELINSLTDCSDAEFVDEVVSRVLYGDRFDIVEIEESESVEE